MYFNSRPSARGDLDWVLSSIKNIISIHAPPRGATCREDSFRGAVRYFNSRPSARGDPDPYCYFCFRGISIHAPPRGATRYGRAVMRPAQFQFTPLREGRLDRVTSGELAVWVISIHAPPRGATKLRGAACWHTKFQFTPLREGRLKRGFSLLPANRFQFTPLREGRRHCCQSPANSCNISIHAPPRGATYKSIKELDGRVISIHAPPRGATVATQR